MPLYEFRCAARHLSEKLCRAGTDSIVCHCGATARKQPSVAVQLNPPTGAAVRSHYSLFREATQEIDHAYARVEADVEHPVQAPDYWNLAKARAQEITAAGEAPTPRPFE